MKLQHHQSERFWAFVAIVTANVIWGVNYVASKKVTMSIDPETITFYRIGGACVLFWVASLFAERERVAWRDLTKMFVGALLGITLNQFLFINGIAKTTPVDASIITTSVPIMVLVLSSMFLHDRITSSKVVGIVLGATGAISLIVYSGAVAFGSGQLMGNLLILLNSVSYAFYMIEIKPVMVKYKSVTVMKWVFLFGALQFLPLGLPAALRYPMAEQSVSVIANVAFIVCGATFLAYLFISYGLASIKASTVSVFSYIQPVVAGAFSILIGIDTLDAIKTASMLMVFAGVYIASLPAENLPFGRWLGQNGKRRS